jgi:N-acetylmuramoyl-L-alanine amidase
LYETSADSKPKRRAYTPTIPLELEAARSTASRNVPARAPSGKDAAAEPATKALRFTEAGHTDEESVIPRKEAGRMNRIACFALLLCVSSAPLAARAAPHASLAGRLFVVDPGHGVRYPDGSPLNVGAVGAGGLEESKITLAVAEDLARRLRAAGARVVLTRSFANPFRVATDRRVDNRARAALANRLGATAFIAVHADGSLDPARRGTSVFWLRPNSEALARAVRAHLAPLGLGESEFRVRDLAVTSEARVPAVLVEIGFVSNPAQARLIATPSFEEREAQALFDAVAQVFAS